VSRPRILVLNQYYRPGVEATANLLADLCESLALDYDVTVVTGRLQGRDDLPHSELLNGVCVLRTRSTSFDRTKLSQRGLNYVTYVADSLVRSLSLEPPDLVVCMTDPPVVGDLGVTVARRFGAPLLVISEDVFPEIATELGRLTNPIVVNVLRRLVAYYLRRADHVVAIGDRMRERLIAKGAAPERISVIPNWVDAELIVPGPRDSAWAREQGLIGRFVVMHSGNVGHAQDLDNLVRATTFLRDLDDLAVPIVGFGARHAEIRTLATLLEADKVIFLPYQPREVLTQSLGSAHIHYVGLAKGLAGFVVPSRLYGILSAGRPVVVAADPDSETARLVEEVGCGVAIPPGRPDLLAAVIRNAHDGKLDLDEMGRRGRAYIEQEADRPVALARYRELVAGLVDAGR
jgi:putative colanic acid biosynthesis glycosyltransferase WcaI